MTRHRGRHPEQFANRWCPVNEPVNENAHERWYQLCQLAAVEPDSIKLLKLLEEVNFLLDVKEEARAAGQRGGNVRVNSRRRS